MKLFNKIFAAAAVSASVMSCSQALEPVAEPQDFSAEAAQLNGNAAVMQALAQSQVINSVKAEGNSYGILLANGTELSLQNEVSAATPSLSIENGIWAVEATSLTGADGSEATSDILPVFSVNAEGKWVAAVEGKDNVLGTAVKDNATVKVFDAVDCTENSFTVKSGAKVLSAPVAAGFLFKIAADGAQKFVLGQTRSYAVTKTGISAATVVAPQGWAVELSETQISITAPHSPVTKAVVADSKTEVSVIAVSTAGYVTIAKVLTDLDEAVSATDPFATLTVGEVKAFSATVNVALQNQTAWYWLLKKAGEAEPTAAEVKAGNAGSETALKLTVEPETEYTLYVLPVGESKDGAVTKISFKTAEVTSWYEAWEAGAEITIGSQTYSKAKNGKGQLITTDGQQIYDGWVNNATFGAFFIEEGVSAFVKNGYNKSLIIIGNKPGTRPAVKFVEQIKLAGTETDLAFKNITLSMTDGMTGGKGIYNNDEYRRIIIEDCYIDMKYPFAQRFNTDGSNAGKMAGLELLNSDICVNWASDCTTPYFITTHAGGAECGDLIVKNNVFWSKDGKKEFHLAASIFSKTAKFNGISVINNTFYNLNNGILSAVTRQRALIAASTVTSFNWSGNIAYDTNPESKGITGVTPHFTWLYAQEMTKEQIGSIMTSDALNIMDIAEYCAYIASDGADYSNGIKNLITWVTGGWSEVASWTNPFQVEKPEIGYFVTTDAYKDYGAQRK